MTFEELKEGLKDIDGQFKHLYELRNGLEEQYIKEHAPLPFRKYQRITIKLCISKEHFDRLTFANRKNPKNQIGCIYTVIGHIVRYIIDSKGRVRPDLYGGVTYDSNDDIISVEPAAQIEGDHKLCRRFKDGYCYMAGGMRLGPICATHKVGASDCLCPLYEERTKLWQGKHCFENVTIKQYPKRRMYRIYSEDWSTFTELTEEYVAKYYRKTEIEKV